MAISASVWLEPTDARTDLSFSSSFGYVAAISLTQYPEVLHVSAFVLHQFCCSNLSIFFARQETTKHFIGPGIPSAKTKHFTSDMTFDFCEAGLKRGRIFSSGKLFLGTLVSLTRSWLSQPSLRTPGRVSPLLPWTSRAGPGLVLCSQEGVSSKAGPAMTRNRRFVICQQEEFHPSGVFLLSLPPL